MTYGCKAQSLALSELSPVWPKQFEAGNARFRFGRMEWERFYVGKTLLVVS